jgi:hypothetical protein
MRGLWSRLLSDAGFGAAPVGADEEELAGRIRRLAHIDDPQQIRFLLRHLDGNATQDPLAQSRITMLYVTLWGRAGEAMSLGEAEARLRANPGALADLRAVLEYRLQHTRTRPMALLPDLAGPLALHAEYTLFEALVGLGKWEMRRRPRFSEGPLHVPQRKVDALFITLDKTEDAYSPTTMYEDYVISDRLFHWQSQSTTSAESETGRRYVHHRAMGYTPLLFVREHRKTAGGLASPYAFLGPAEYASHEDSKPMSIVWRLANPIPVRLLRATADSA